jgi:hypothetical protein
MMRIEHAGIAGLPAPPLWRGFSFEPGTSRAYRRARAHRRSRHPPIGASMDFASRREREGARDAEVMLKKGDEDDADVGCG